MKIWKKNAKNALFGIFPDMFPITEVIFIKRRYLIPLHYLISSKYGFSVPLSDPL